MEQYSIHNFYKDIFGDVCPDLDHFLNSTAQNDIGHFNVFDIAALYECGNGKPKMPYSRRMYYKISLIKGKNKVEYADKLIEVKDCAILFATPKIPYYYQPIDNKQAGHFCVFTKEFLPKSKIGLNIDELPIFSSGSEFIYEIGKDQYKEISAIFKKMHNELASDYAFKYDLLRNIVMELIHTGQKLNPVKSEVKSINASSRLSALFIELMERQFPMESPANILQLRTAKDYADRLNVHVNYLNKVLKDTTGRTTTDIIAGRITQEAKILLKQTSWNVSEIAYSLGFEEVAHFSNFFKKQSDLSPLLYRN